MPYFGTICCNLISLLAKWFEIPAPNDKLKIILKMGGTAPSSPINSKANIAARAVLQSPT